MEYRLITEKNPEELDDDFIEELFLKIERGVKHSNSHKMKDEAPGPERKCTKCGERFLNEDVSEWRAGHEDFSLRPFICPDCYDRFSRMDLADQFNELLSVEK